MKNEDWDRDHWVRFGSLAPWQWVVGLSLWLGGGWSGDEWMWALGVGILVAGVGLSGYRRIRVPIGARNWREAVEETIDYLKFPRGTRWLLSRWRPPKDGSGWKPNWHVVAWRWVCGWKRVPYDKENTET